jgi:dynein heavy chain
VNVDFAKTMNKIIFDKHCNEKQNNLITGKLDLPPPVEKKETPYFGMIRIPPHDYPLVMTKFCLRSLNRYNEVIIAQQKIRQECNDVAAKDIYNPNITKTMKVEEFKQIQSSSTTQIGYYLKETWLNKLKEIIKGQFEKPADQGALAGFNLNVA